jgi:hypothetical protein
LTTAAPPRISMDVTMMLVSRQNTRKVKWATVPQRACSSSSSSDVGQQQQHQKGQERASTHSCVLPKYKHRPGRHRSAIKIDNGAVTRQVHTRERQQQQQRQRSPAPPPALTYAP